MLYKKGCISSVLPGVCPSVQMQEFGKNELAGILKCLGDTTVLRIDWAWLHDDLGNLGFVCVMTQHILARVWAATSSSLKLSIRKALGYIYCMYL